MYWLDVGIQAITSGPGYGVEGAGVVQCCRKYLERRMEWRRRDKEYLENTHTVQIVISKKVIFNQSMCWPLRCNPVSVRQKKKKRTTLPFTPPLTPFLYLCCRAIWIPFQFWHTFLFCIHCTEIGLFSKNAIINTVKVKIYTWPFHLVLLCYVVIQDWEFFETAGAEIKCYPQNSHLFPLCPCTTNPKKSHNNVLQSWRWK